jgi:integrase
MIKKLTFKFTETNSGFKVLANDGTQFSLRRNGRGFQARSMVNYKRIAFSAKSADHKTAAVNAHAAIKAAQGGDTTSAVASQKRSPYPTITALCNAFENGHAENAKAYRHACTLKLKAIITQVTGQSDWDKVRADVVTGELAAAFLAKRVGNLTGLKLVSAKRTANSIFRQAKAVFSSACLAKSTSPFTGFVLPLESIREFKAVPFFKKVSVRSKVRDTAPFIDVLLTNLPALREADPAAYLVVLLAAGCGFRLTEALQARKSWIVGNEIEIQATENWETKSREARTVRLPDHVKSEILLLSDDSEYIVPARNFTDRNRKIGDRIAVWFKQENNWPFKHTTHELRKWAGSKVLTQTQSMIATRDFLGHSTIAVTEQYYAELLEKPEYEIDLAIKAA